MKKLLGIKHSSYLCCLVVVEFLSLWGLNSASVEAQIIPDRTLGAESSVVVTNEEIEGVKSDRLEGGAIRGNNLFHSFQEFNIDAGRGAYFANPAAIENIFTRVTGSNPSEILGTLGVLGDANLFLLNPNGIIFGNGARLDLGGSFFATTADSIAFPDGTEFKATNPNLPPLLTVEVEQPIGLKFAGESGMITNAANLAVAEQKTLSLAGGEVENKGNLTAPGGRIEILGTESVALVGAATIDVAATSGGGTVVIGGDRNLLPSAQRTYIGDGVRLNATALDSGNGGKVTVWSDRVTGFYGQINATGGSEAGNGGSVEVSSQEQLIFRGTVDTRAVNGLVGELLLDPTDIIIANGSGANSQGIDFILGAPSEEIENTEPITIFESDLEALAGDNNLVLEATNNIILQNLTDDSLELTAGEGEINFIADADSNGTGDFIAEDLADTIFTRGRDISISGTNLTLGNIDTSQLNKDGGAITLSAKGNISGGNLNSSSVDNAQEEAISGNGGAMEISASGDLFLGNLNSASAANAGLVATSGTGGTINVSADGNISTGNISSSSLAFTPLGIGNIAGDGGDIFLEAGNKLNFGDIEAIGLLGGSITINSGADLAISDRFILSFTVGSGVGSDIELNAPLVSLTDSAKVFNVTIGEMGKGGGVIVNTDLESGKVEVINDDGFSPRNIGNPLVALIRDNVPGTSFLTATGGGAKGGDLTINTGELVIRNNFDLEDLNINEGELLFSPVVGAASVNTPPINILNLPFSTGKSGDLTVNATKSVTITGSDNPESFIPTSDRQATILTNDAIAALTTIAVGIGDGGDLTVNTAELNIEFGGGVSAGTSSREGTTGNGGDLTVNADRVKLQGRGGIASSTLNTGNAGNLTVNADAGSVTLLDGATIATDTIGSGEAGELTITTTNLFVGNGSRIGTATFAGGSGGTLTIDAANSIELVGTSADGGFSSGLFALSNSDSRGDAGNIILNTNSLAIADGAIISAQTEGTGDGGTITVDAPQEVLIKNNSQLTVATSGAGEPGDIAIATDSLTIGKDSEISATATVTSTNTEGGGTITIDASNLDLIGKLGIFAETQGVAPAGTLNIKPNNNQPDLNIRFNDTASISASTTSGGTGGDINLTAPETIDIKGQGTLAVETTGTGDAGSINITTQNLNLSQQTEISASTFSSGRAGDIRIRARDFNLTEGATIITDTTSSGQEGDIQLQISDNLNLVDSAIAASTGSNSVGQGGNINIGSATVKLDNSQIAVNSQGEGTGGSIILQADNLTLDSQSAINAETLSTDGGNINLGLSKDLVLRENSQISATAGTAQAGGDGGNIIIDTRFILTFPLENSDISANAFLGNGGNITIDAESILGLELRSQATSFSDITASSEFGLAGNVEINTLETDPDRGLVSLPQQALDTEVVLGCDADEAGAIAFYDLGRGGFASTPQDFFLPDTAIEEWLPLAPDLPTKLQLNKQEQTSLTRKLVPACQ